MKCSDISDNDVLAFLALYQGRWSTWGKDYGSAERFPSLAPSVARAMPVDTPPKLQLAKMRQLHKRGFVGGCPCGCRGDWEITDKGLEFIGQPRTIKYNGY